MSSAKRVNNLKGKSACGVAAAPLCPLLPHALMQTANRRGQQRKPMWLLMLAQVAAMPRQQLSSLWQQFLHAFAALLLRMRGNLESAPARKLVRSASAPFSSAPFQ